MRRREFLKGSLAAGVGVIGMSGEFDSAPSEPVVPSERAQEVSPIFPLDLRCESLHNPLHAVLVGSGRSAVDVLHYDTRHTLLAVINNAYRLRNDWDIAFVPDNFTGIRPAPNRDQIVISHEGPLGYARACESIVGSLGEAGMTMLFSSAYWLLWMARPLGISSIGFLGCDLDYEPDDRGYTHFYGVGHDTMDGAKPDPVRMLEATFDDDYSTTLPRLLQQLSQHAHHAGVALVNHSDNPKSQLPFPYDPFDPTGIHAKAARSRTPSNSATGY